MFHISYSVPSVRVCVCVWVLGTDKERGEENSVDGGDERSYLCVLCLQASARKDCACVSAEFILMSDFVMKILLILNLS